MFEIDKKKIPNNLLKYFRPKRTITQQGYIDHLMIVFNECKRVLRKDGVLFVNIGDTYNASGMGSYGKNAFVRPSRNAAKKVGKKTIKDMQEKSMCNIPEKFCLAMEKEGWIKRCSIIWVKSMSFGANICPHCGKPLIKQLPDEDDLFGEIIRGKTISKKKSGSCMPDSCADRPNKNGFEYLYMFTQGKKYWYEQQYEEAQELNAERPRMGQGNQTKYHSKRGYGGGGSSLIGHSGTINADGEQIGNPLGRTIRNVWAINPEPNSWNYCKVCDTVFEGNSCPKCGAEMSKKLCLDCQYVFEEKDENEEVILNCPKCGSENLIIPLTGHYATFPQKLVEPMIKMSVPEYVCTKCGKAREKMYKKVKGKDWNRSKSNNQRKIMGCGAGIDFDYARINTPKKFIGYNDCGCGAGWRAGIVLDIFAGSGTVGIVAAKLKRDYILIELQLDYVRIAEERLKEIETDVPNKERLSGQKGLFE